MDFHRVFAFALCLFFTLASSHAMSTDLSQKIDAYLEQYAATMTAKGYRVESEAGNIDPRLSEQSCNEELAIAFKRDPLRQSRTTIEVQCTGDTPWKLYVSANVEIFGAAIVAASPIARGAIISTADLTLAETQVNAGRADIITDSAHVEGMIARRSIPAGQHLSSRVLKAPELVDRGDQVIIVAQGSAVAIKTQGTALSSGSLGQQISVRNNRSERVIRARVVDRGRVAITL